VNYRSMIAALAAGVVLVACNVSASGFKDDALPNASPIFRPVRILGSDASRGSFRPFASSISSKLRYINPVTLKSQIAVSTYEHSVAAPIEVYSGGNKKNKPPFCEISAAQGGSELGADSSGNLWVPELNGASGPSDLLEFAPNCGKLKSTLSDPGEAVSIAFATNGTVYVGNGRSGNVAVYAKRATAPSRYLTNSQFTYVDGAGVNSKGDVFVTYRNETSDTGMLEFVQGKMPGEPVRFGLADPGSPEFDRNGNMIITDDWDDSLNVYAPPYGENPQVYSLKGSSQQCSLNKTQTAIACNDRTNRTIDVYRYPTINYEYSFSNGLEGYVEGLAWIYHT
jgi:hypothetical protein